MPDNPDISTEDSPYEPEKPDRIGPYRVLEKIGEGGMGRVFLAEQVTPVRRRVAIKLIKPGMDSRQVIRRFEAERQAMAMMSHPNVAAVFDAGVSESGHSYFVMEYVPGIPITKFCDTHRLTIPERLHLFVQVCNAIQHAHQKGIIHRDIKPSNILVMRHDKAVIPKVIDFGVAKATDHRLTEHTLYTAHGMIVGTPAYMSPEQAEMSPLAVDTRTDVYSLGVLLYEMLTGALPFEPKRLQKADYDELRRIIREVEPPKPSTRFDTMQEDSGSSVAEQRRLDSRGLSRRLRGELDWITMKALDKDPARRYETANGLALDVERFLQGDPVQAGPPSAVYRLRKFVQRNRGTAFASVAIGGSLLVGIVIAFYGLLQVSNANVKLQAANSRLTTAVEETRLQKEAAEAAQRQAEDERANAIAARVQEKKAREQAEEAQRQAEDERAKAIAANKELELTSQQFEAIEDFLTNTLTISLREEKTEGRARETELRYIPIEKVMEDAQARVDSLSKEWPRVEPILRATMARCYELQKDASNAAEQYLALSRYDPRGLGDVDWIDRAWMVYADVGDMQSARQYVRQSIAAAVARGDRAGRIAEKLELWAKRQTTADAKRELLEEAISYYISDEDFEEAAFIVAGFAQEASLRLEADEAFGLFLRSSGLMIRDNSDWDGDWWELGLEGDQVSVLGFDIVFDDEFSTATGVLTATGFVFQMPSLTYFSLAALGASEDELSSESSAVRGLRNLLAGDYHAASYALAESQITHGDGFPTCWFGLLALWFGEIDSAPLIIEDLWPREENPNFQRACRAGIGYAHLSRKDFAAAEKVFREAKAMPKQPHWMYQGEPLPFRAPFSRSDIFIDGGLARALFANGKVDEAEVLLTPTLGLLTIIRNTMQRIPSLRGYDYGIFGENHAELLAAAGRYEEAEEIYREVLETRVLVVPLGHPSLAVTHANLARIIGKQGRFAEAEVEMLTAYDELLRHPTPPMRFKRIIEEYLAELYSAQHDLSQSSDFERTAAVWRRQAESTRRLEDEHTHAVRTLSKQVLETRRQEQMEKATEDVP